MTATTTGRTQAEVTIGVIGPHELVEKIMLSGTQTVIGSVATEVGSAASGVAAAGVAPELAGGVVPATRLVAAAYRDEQEAPDKVQQLGAGTDAWLFGSQMSHEYARRAGVVTGPATFVPLGGSALYAALLRAGRSQTGDPARSSIDMLSRADVQDAFAEFGISWRAVQLRSDPGSPAVIASFHERLWRRGSSSMAFTCLRSVETRLSDAGVPVIGLRPTGSAIRAALQTAALLGSARRLKDAQLAVAVVEVPALLDTGRRATQRQAREELRLTVHRFLVQEAQRIEAAVTPTSHHGFLVTATRSSLSLATDGFRMRPFAERARRELDIAIEVGIGMGRTTAEAEAHARAALGRARLEPGSRGFTLDAGGLALLPAPRRPPAEGPGRLRAMEILARLASKLPDADPALVVDAEKAGSLLSVTPRTARRLLRTLVDEGLAWPLPPSRMPQPGRPRQFYRVVVERLGQRAPR